MISLSLGATAQQEETAQQTRMAEFMAANMDDVWDKAPDDGTGNIQILMMKDGEPIALPVSFYGHFKIMARYRSQYHQSFNPNSNGRFVLEQVDPGMYTIVVEGLGDYKGMRWEFNGYEVKENEYLTIEITVK